MHEVIFDVDGTLWDSTEQVAVSWRDTCSRYEIPCEHITGERLKKEVGKTLPDIGFSLFPDLPEDEAIRVTQEACDEENAYLLSHPPGVFEEVPGMLAALKAQGIPVFIVSNCQSGYIEVMLETSGLGHLINGHLCAGDTGVPKAETLGIAIEKWKLRSPVYVGDTAGDEASAGAAGMPFIHAAYGFGTAVRPACVISSPGQLPGILDSPELRKEES